MRVYGAIIAGALLAGACSSDNVKLNGRFAGCNPDHKVYLEKIVPNGQQTIDSAKLNKKCSFAFSFNIDDDQPALFNLRYDNELIPLMISPGEKITVNSLANISHNYEVEGSPLSERIRQLHSLLTDGALTLSGMWTEIRDTPEGDRREKLIRYQQEYNRIKREHLSFVMTDPGSLAAVYAVYQRLPGDHFLFSEGNDIIYYRMVADSAGKRHPGSPYVQALQKEVASADKTQSLIDMINASAQDDGGNFIDISLSDMYGNDHRLSWYRGNVIVLDFWSSASPTASVNNAEYKELYTKYFAEGLEIFQVSADTNKALWVRAVQDQKLPWISVCDFNGPSSTALRHYNVTQVPTNYLIDRRGNIVERGVYGDRLEAKIKELLK